MGLPSPRVSILIPNFNNGRQSSKSGQQDFLGDLLKSLCQTLTADPTPLEIVVYDDGSNDDSLATARDWAARRWPAEAAGGRAGTPFLRLIEAPHCGYLSRTANVLCREGRGEFLVRLDGDIVCLTPRWVSIMCGIFDANRPNLAIVGPKQLSPDMRIHAMGDWLLHPNGYIHVAQGLDRWAVRQAIEVDHVMGCFHCMRKAAWQEAGGYDENFLRGQTEDLGLRIRQKGWSCLAVPDFEFVHYHALRKSRETEADTGAGIQKTLQIFRDKWGFCRLAPDLDAVRTRYAGSPMLWNPRWFGSPAGAEPCDAPPAAASADAIDIQQTDWGRYARDERFRAWIDLRVAVAVQVAGQVNAKAIALAGCGPGLIPHLIATAGWPITATDRHAVHVAFARRCVRDHKYQGQRDGRAARPDFIEQPDWRVLPFGDGTVDLLLLFDQLERHPNPPALLAQARRVLAPGGTLALISQRKPAREDGPTDPEHRYRWHELVNQVNAVGGWQLLSDPRADDVRRDMVLLARRLPAAGETPLPRAQPAAAAQAANLAPLEMARAVD